MRRQKREPQSITGLLQQVDDLALQFVLGAEPEGPDCKAPFWLVALEKIAATAAAADLDTVASDANALKSTLRRLRDSREEFAEAAQSGMHRLQEVLCPGREEPVASEPVPELEPEPEPPAPAPVEVPEAVPEAPPVVASEPVRVESSLAEDPELVRDFITESREHLQSIEKHLLAIEQDANAEEAINAIFRAFHTIKGLAGFLEFENIRVVAHETETLLDLARNGTLEMTPQTIDIVLESADHLNGEVQRIDTRHLTGQAGPSADHSALLARIRCRIEGTAGVEETETEPAQAAPPPADYATQPVATVEPAVKPAGNEPAEKPKRQADALSGSIKVDTGKLDFLIDMVGEMVIAQSLLRHSPELAGLHAATLQRHIAQLSRITDEVQKTAMSMRMVPIGGLFHKMARLTRDVSRKAGKPVELITAGEDTELDRIRVEELADPLMHMVRNGIDHGVESPEVRVAAGKPATGHIELRAYHQSGSIVIEVNDDGRGMEREGILRKAREKGLVEDGSSLPDTDVFNLVFEPGFSTAEKVSDISGRGVGMDVVKRHIQSLRGSTEIKTEVGKGTSFKLKLPLTLAIIDGLIVGVGKDRYIVPIFAVKEVLQPTVDMVSTIEGRREVALVRGRLLPVVRLYKRFGLEPCCEDPLKSLLIITEAQGREYCLMVDSLLGKQEVVIKNLGETFKSVQGIAGGAILGDGRVGLILDINAIFHSRGMN
jgi:two-component system chemotaxis sensor kinase CheA